MTEIHQLNPDEAQTFIQETKAFFAEAQYGATNQDFLDRFAATQMYLQMQRSGAQLGLPVPESGNLILVLLRNDLSVPEPEQDGQLGLQPFSGASLVTLLSRVNMDIAFVPSNASQGEVFAHVPHEHVLLLNMLLQGDTADPLAALDLNHSYDAIKDELVSLCKAEPSIQKCWPYFAVHGNSPVLLVYLQLEQALERERVESHLKESLKPLLRPAYIVSVFSQFSESSLKSTAQQVVQSTPALFDRSVKQNWFSKLKQRPQQPVVITFPEDQSLS